MNNTELVLSTDTEWWPCAFRFVFRGHVACEVADRHWRHACRQRVDASVMRHCMCSSRPTHSSVKTHLAGVILACDFSWSLVFETHRRRQLFPTTLKHASDLKEHTLHSTFARDCTGAYTKNTIGHVLRQEYTMATGT